MSPPALGRFSHEAAHIFKGAVSRYSVIFCAFLHEDKMATAHASVADIRPWQLGQPREQLHHPSWVEKMSFSSSNCCFPRPCLVAAIIFPHTKWLPKITDYRDTAALNRLKRLIVLNSPLHVIHGTEKLDQVEPTFVPLIVCLKIGLGRETFSSKNHRSVRWIVWKALQSGRALFRWEDYYIVFHSSCRFSFVFQTFCKCNQSFL